MYNEADNFIVKNFTQQDIAEAAQLTLLTWGEEIALHDDMLKNVLYEAMVRYYFRSSEFSFKLADAQSGITQGFLLAAPLSERDCSQKWLRQTLADFALEEQDLVYNYLRYLSYNGQQVRRYAKPQDLLLCLFLSRKPGVGAKLLQNIETVAKEHQISSLYLWADATCDYSYYRRRGYEEACRFTNTILPELGAQETWIYRKKM